MTEHGRELAVMQFKSAMCSCGQPKLPREAFCERCYFALPRAMRRALIGTYGERFELAYFAAVDWLTQRRPIECVNPES